MRKTVLISAVVAAFGTASAYAQTSPAPGRHAMHLIKLPNGDYTVPLSELQGSGTSGKVTLHPQGLKTIVTIYTFGSSRHRHAFGLHAGSDCGIVGTPQTIALVPALTGQPSRTILSLPIDNFTTHDYVIAAKNATATRQFGEACARL